MKYTTVTAIVDNSEASEEISVLASEICQGLRSDICKWESWRAKKETAATTPEQRRLLQLLDGKGIKLYYGEDVVLLVTTRGVFIVYR